MKKSKIKRKRKNKFNVFTIIYLLIVFIILSNLHTKFVKNRTILLNDPINYEKSISTTALIVRDEYVYAESGNINLEGLKDKKVNVNNSIGSISNSVITELKLADINKAIDTIKDKIEVKVDNSNISGVAELIRNEEYRAINEIPTENNNIQSKEYKDYLIKKYEILKKMLETNGVNIKSLNSGIVSSKVDGYEDIYNVYNINLDNININLSDINIDNKSTNKGLKIINNNYYAMIFSVDGKKMEKAYNINDKISIKINDKIIDGYVGEVKIDEGIYTLSAYFDTNFDIVKDNRFYNAKLINYETKAFKIPQKSIINKEGTKGVYIKSPSGIVEFRPVKVLSNKDKKVLVDSGIDGILKIKGKDQKTVESFDEIIKNPKRVKEGELIE